MGKVHATDAFFPTKKKRGTRRGSERVLFGFSPYPTPLSLILLSPEENRDGTEKGIQFWIERLIMSLSGNSVLGGLGFRRAEVFSKPRIGKFWGWCSEQEG